MAEQLINEFTVNRPIDEAWSIITDVERIAPCMPGAELQEREGDVYRGVVKVKLGAISSQFKGDAQFVEQDDEQHRATIKAKGRDTGGRGNASAEIMAQAASLSPTSTKCVVTTDLHITGKVAQFGRGILGDVSAKLMDQFAANLNEMLDQEGLTAVADTGTADTGTTTATDTGTGDTGAAGSERADEPGTDAPQVQRFEGPATEPIDLMELGGSSIAKRAVPALLALLVIVLLLRRRRS